MLRGMRQLTGLDMQFLNIETSTTVGHVAGLSILDPSAAPAGVVTVDRLRELLASRLHLAKPLRWRLVEVPFGIDKPYWIEDPDFDLEFHVREIGLPAPGDERQLGEQISRLHARPLDRRRPLWEFYLIHGLEGGRQALYGKVHHAAIDGVSGAEILGVLMDMTPEPREVPPPAADWEPEQPPSQVTLIGNGVLRLAAHPIRTLRYLPRTLPHLDELPGAQMVPGTGLISGASGRVSRLARLAPSRREVPDRPKLDVPRTPFNGPITPHRRFAFGSLPLDDVKTVKNAFGITVNDVVMALCATTLRRWLIDHDALPSQPLVAAVPVSVRTQEQRGAAGNQISVMLAPIATHLADPVERLNAVHDAMLVAKRRFQALPAALLQEFSEMLPTALAGLAARAASRLVARSTPPFNLFISNVPGPQIPLYSVGARMTGHYPVSAITDASGGLNITVFSYDGHLDFGLIACREMVPDVWNMIDYLREALDELVALAKTQESGQG
jgi:diacylglycerol O-acyltransferase